MRFRRYGRFAFQDTPRRRAAVLRKQAAERAALPLFAEQIAAEQPAVDAVMADRHARWDARETAERQRRAALWCKGRARMHQYPAVVRARLLDYWNRHRWLPGDPVYFLDMMHMHDTGQLNLDAPGVLTAESFTG